MKSVHGFWPDFILKTSRFKGNALLVHHHKIRDINIARFTLYCFEYKGHKNHFRNDSRNKKTSGYI